MAKTIVIEGAYKKGDVFHCEYGFANFIGIITNVFQSNASEVYTFKVLIGNHKPEFFDNAFGTVDDWHIKHTKRVDKNAVEVLFNEK